MLSLDLLWRIEAAFVTSFFSVCIHSYRQALFPQRDLQLHAIGLFLRGLEMKLWKLALGPFIYRDALYALISPRQLEDRSCTLAVRLFPPESARSTFEISEDSSISTTQQQSINTQSARRSLVLLSN